MHAHTHTPTTTATTTTTTTTNNVVVISNNNLNSNNNFGSHFIFKVQNMGGKSKPLFDPSGCSCCSFYPKMPVDRAMRRARPAASTTAATLLLNGAPTPHAGFEEETIPAAPPADALAVEAGFAPAPTTPATTTTAAVEAPGSVVPTAHAGFEEPCSAAAATSSTSSDTDADGENDEQKKEKKKRKQEFKAYVDDLGAFSKFHRKSA